MESHERTPRPAGPGDYIAVPARARDEIGALAFDVENMMRNLREVNEHLQDSSRDVPGVLRELRDVVTMTEAATVRVLEETEALMEEQRAALALIADLRRRAEAGAVAELAGPLGQLEALVTRADSRNMTIMSALEFQDLTAQKVHRAFEMLEEVGSRLSRIRALVDDGHAVDPAPPPPPRDPLTLDGRAGQQLADELLRGFRE